MLLVMVRLRVKVIITASWVRIRVRRPMFAIAPLKLHVFP